mmetsp:Transcript_51995/g.143975  ORF Transcript_51995/g.143975 Transcript_51995/m.143975 type:complete len:227 (+) Transcript_51995:607-1287(+)
MACTCQGYAEQTQLTGIPEQPRTWLKVAAAAQAAVPLLLWSRPQATHQRGPGPLLGQWRPPARERPPASEPHATAPQETLAVAASAGGWQPRPQKNSSRSSLTPPCCTRTSGSTCQQHPWCPPTPRSSPRSGTRQHHHAGASSPSWEGGCPGLGVAAGQDQGAAEMASVRWQEQGAPHSLHEMLLRERGLASPLLLQSRQRWTSRWGGWMSPLRGATTWRHAGKRG